MLTTEQAEQFNSEGYIILENFTSTDSIRILKETTLEQLENRVPPFELESDLQYPGAPGANQLGAHTIRRLKQAYDRSFCFQDWSTQPALSEMLQQLLGEPAMLVRAHHNCVMTKQPEFSSDSLWHQDLRYWNYSTGRLISAWLALGNESLENGCLQVIPQSHTFTFKQHQFDEALFFRHDLPENQKILNKAIPVELKPGDLLLFHCRLLHAATRNYSSETKLSAVFTYRAESDEPVTDSRSASISDISLF
ncbi:phytanoyl-CoA dioxygenase family protein [Pleionea sediminis]|uniref:phytanoyl-CoA dioxygenase family protein n=1 Tax=Pleionea sediminis TaxID=2569479 RepID=UPI0011860E2A|nr:phytanoyl-CoA dioxygenase family protein [Pleionea sediminis]